MMNNENNMSMTVVKQNFFRRILDKIRSIFKNKTTYEIEENNSHLNQKNSMEYIKIVKDEEQIRIEKLKNDLDNNIISVYDINDDDVDKLIKVYDENILKLKAETLEYKKIKESCKKQILELNEKLKAYTN